VKKNSSLTAVVIGASGYAGSELCRLVARHPLLTLAGCFVSEGSVDAGTKLSVLYPKLRGVVDLPLQGLDSLSLKQIKATAQVVFIATEHEAAAQLAYQLYDNKRIIIDLSGAHRLAEVQDYVTHYGFSHPHPQLLSEAVYGLAEWHTGLLANANLIAVPGCYPTATLLALKPVQHLLASQPVIVNAVSGVTGAGRKPTHKTLGAELSLQGYGVFNHRHQPEIEQHGQTAVVFTPHLGAFKRGILATLYLQLAEGTSCQDVAEAYAVYQKHPCVRVGYQHTPAIQDVEHSGYCDIGWHRKGTQLIVFAAIDNLLKGAASQALQCLNLRLGEPQTTGVPL